MRKTSELLVTILVAASAAWPVEGSAAYPAWKAPPDRDTLPLVGHLLELAQAAAPPAAAAPTPTPTTPTATPGSPGGELVPPTDLNWLTTGSVSKDLAAAVKECGRYDPAYRIDCLRQNIERIARTLPDQGGYRNARNILERAARKLGAIVEANADQNAPRLRPPAGANPRFLQHRSYRAIRRDRLKSAMSQASDVIREAATELLRSSENSQSRLAHYQSMATAVGSTKVLLRSS